MRQVKCQRHIIICFVGGIAKHHTLVAGALFFFLLPVNTLVDIGRLFVNGRKIPQELASNIYSLLV